MVLDTLLFKVEKGGNPNLIRQSQKSRFKSVDVVQEIIDLERDIREANHSVSKLNEESKKLNKSILVQKSAGEPFDELVGAALRMQETIKKASEEADMLQRRSNELMKSVGNIVHASVPVSDNEANNRVLRSWGEIPQGADLLKHYDLLEMIDACEMERGINIAGTRGYYLKGVGVLLNQAVINYALATLTKQGFTALQTPYLIRKDVAHELAHFEPQIQEQIYHVIENSGGTADKQKTEDNEKYLISTSEIPISAYHRREWILERDLPKKYAGYSTCFRKENLNYGRDTMGIFRVHQFEKIEQFCVTEPEKSWEVHEEMIRNAEEFYQSLGIPYRVVSVVSGALNNATSKEYDLEGWFPGHNCYRELVSCSNCTDYQSRDLGIRCGAKKQNQTQKKYVHMLNSTLAATTRVICCILENYQTEGGINVPKALQPYLDMDFIPFVKERRSKLK